MKFPPQKQHLPKLPPGPGIPVVFILFSSNWPSSESQS